MSDRKALAREIAARTKPRFVEIPRERGGIRAGNLKKPTKRKPVQIRGNNGPPVGDGCIHSLYANQPVKHAAAKATQERSLATAPFRTSGPYST